MPVATFQFVATTTDLKQQRASRRASSLSKDRTKYKKHSEASSITFRKGSTAPAGSDSTTPHGAVRAATRASLAKAAIAGSSDMPKISMYRAGKKPSVCKVGDAQLSIEELEMDEYLIAVAAKYSQYCRNAACMDDATAVSAPVCPFEADLEDQKAFPALALTKTKSAPLLLRGASGVDADKDAMSRVEVTPEKFPKNVAEDTVDAGASIKEHDGEGDAVLTPEKVHQAARQPHREADELAADWVVVASDDVSKAATSSNQVANTSFDGQHPRNVFGKKSVSTRPASEVDAQETVLGIDWSQVGMPTDLLRRLIRGSVNAAHHGAQPEIKMSPTPNHILRAQNAGSSKRERSTSVTPRSHSKPRAMRQTSRGR